jgi:hypothetical protein
MTHVEVLTDAVRNLSVRNDGALLPACQRRIGRVRRGGDALWVRQYTLLKLTVVVIEVYPGIGIARHPVDDSSAAAVHAQVVRAVSARLFRWALTATQRVAGSDDATSVACPLPGRTSVPTVEVRGRLVVRRVVSWSLLAETRAPWAILHKQVDVTSLGIAKGAVGVVDVPVATGSLQAVRNVSW